MLPFIKIKNKLMEKLGEGYTEDKILIPFTYYPGKDLSPLEISKKQSLEKFIKIKKIQIKQKKKIPQ